MKRYPLCSKIIVLIFFLLVPSLVAKSETIDKNSLSASFTEIFAAEFENRETARIAWAKFGGRALASIEKDIYPPISQQSFEKNALNHFRSARAAKPDLTPEQLSIIALEGIAPATQDSQFKQIVVFGVSKRFDTFGGYKAWVLSEIKPRKIKEPKPSLYSRNSVEFTIPVLMISSFTAKSLPNQLIKKLSAHKGKIILDLRGNSGGLLVGAVDLTALFIGAKKNVFMLGNKTGKEKGFLTSRKLSRINSKEFLVLIDEKTNGVALVVAAALKEHGLAKIAGKRTKAIQDRVFTMSHVAKCASPAHSCGLKVPTGILLSPSGRPLKSAVKIDYPVNWDEADASKMLMAIWRPSTP